MHPLFTWALGSCVDGNSPEWPDQKTVFSEALREVREKVTLQESQFPMALIAQVLLQGEVNGKTGV